MSIQPYLFFEGQCDEAIAFYTDALGAKVTLLERYKDAPHGAPPNLADKVMHASLQIGEATLMLSDGHCDRKPGFQGFALTITAKDSADVERIFSRLSERGQVRQPLQKTFFSERFGMVSDRFGVLWMVMVD